MQLLPNRTISKEMIDLAGGVPIYNSVIVTQAYYNILAVKEPNTLYNIDDGSKIYLGATELVGDNAGGDNAMDVLGIAGIYAWFDPRDSIVSASNAVSQYTNKVSGNPHAVEATGSLQAITGSETIFGRPSITADGVNDRLIMDASGTPISLGDLTVHFTFKVPSFTGANRVPLELNVGTNDDRFGVYITTTGGVNVFCKWSNVSTTLNGTDAVVTSGSEYVGTLEYDHSTRRIRVLIDDVEVLNDTVISSMDVAMTELLFFDDFSGGNDYPGSIGEVMLIEAIPTDEERAEQVAHLRRAEVVSETPFLGIVSNRTNTAEAALRTGRTTDYVNYNFIHHEFKENSTKDLVFTWYNGSFLEQTPFQGTCHFFLRGEFYIDGERYPYTFNGAKQAFLTRENGIVSNDPLQVPEAVKGAKGWELTERIAVTGSNIVFNADGTIDEGASVDTVLGQQWVTNGTLTSGSNTVTNVTGIANYEEDYRVSGTGIPSGAYITSVDVGANSFTINSNATVTGVQSLTIDLAWQWDNSLVGGSVSQCGRGADKNLTSRFGDTLTAEFGFTFDPAVITGDEITDINIDSVGLNYSTSLSIAMFRGWGTNDATEEFPGSGSGSAYTTGGGPTVFTGNLPSGSGNDPINPPRPYASSGLYASAGVWGSISVMAEVPAGTVNIHAVGHSTMAGGTTDVEGNYNIHQYLLSNYGHCRMAAQGRSAVGFIQNSDEHELILDHWDALGHKPSHVYISLGINDFGSTTNPAATIGESALANANNVANLHRDRWPDIHVIMPTMPSCRTTSTDSWQSLANQTAYSPAYLPDDANPATANGQVQWFNDNLNTICDTVVDLRDIMNDPTELYKWRLYDDNDFPLLGAGDTLRSSSDGIHWRRDTGQLIKNTRAPLTL